MPRRSRFPMSKTTSLALIGASASIATIAKTPSLRAFLARWTGVGAPGGIWRIIAIILALANLKVLPFVWHIRFFRAFLYHLYLQPTRIPPSALFQPLITSTRAPILEIDYNLHKSNSTYFSDMDISRTHLFTAIMRNGIRKNSRRFGGRRDTSLDKPGDSPVADYIIALGGIGCMFKREVLPYKKYEMWTRLLCWDRKWFYLVTHLVKPGVGKPEGFTLQPWRKAGRVLGKQSEEEREKTKEKLRGAVYATALARYVIKKGRLTISPEQALVDAEMVPKKPEGWVYGGDLSNGELNGGLNGHANGDVNGAVLPGIIEGSEWNWDVIEKERRRGLELAEKFTALEGLHEVFDGGKDGALGEYFDLLF